MVPFPTLADPRLLVRVVDQVGGGNRRPRALAEALDVEVRRVEQAIRSARWLGFLRAGEDLTLSDDGLRLFYAGSRRARVYGEVVRAHGFLGLAVSPPGVVDLDLLTAAVRAADPELSPVAARRRAGVLGRLAEPGLKLKPAPQAGQQLGLSFGTPARAAPPRLDLRAGAEDSPDVYICLLRALLDHGELTTAQVRSVLDAAGADTCPLGPYIATAVRRGDVTRHGDRLVVSQGALDRRALAASAVTVALSDPGFRTWIDGARSGSTPAGRYRLWADRFFRPGTVDDNLERLLFGRPLASIPAAGEAGPPLPTPTGPFLEQSPRTRMAVSVPSSLLGLAEGIGGVNRGLRLAHLEPSAVRAPSATDARLLVHGGVFSPGEAPVRTLADGVSLRQRLVRHTPAATLLVAAGVLERKRRIVLSVRRDGIRVERPRRGSRGFHQVVDGLARTGDWALVAGPEPADWSGVATALVGAGLLAVVGPRLTIDEAFFFRLQTDPEYRHLWDQLQPWVGAVADAVSPPLSA